MKSSYSHGIELGNKKAVEFNACNVMGEIRGNPEISSHEKDKLLAIELQKKINPSGEDGNCSGCAIHTCMALLGYGSRMAPRPNELTEYMSDFYDIHKEQLLSDGIKPEKNENYGDFRGRVELSIMKSTNHGEAVMLSIGQGSHWIAGYNDGERVWFVDSQTGKGFNLYDDKEKSLDALVNDFESIQLVKVKPGYFTDYSKSGSWESKKIIE
jgi:hypothetical protein